MSKPPLRLGVNIDHVATIRNARGGLHPDPVRAAELAASAGADGITAHLREDRRHIRDDDMRRLKEEISLPLNFEMASTAEMLKICLEVAPHACCIVPENRNERTTEGGLDVVGQHNFIAPFIRELMDAGIRVSLFIDPEIEQIEAAYSTGAPVIEIPTGAYYEATAETMPKKIEAEFAKIKAGAEHGAGLGLEIHAGHGLTFKNVQPVAAIPEIRELNIGHFLIGESVFTGLGEAVKEMKKLMQDARTGCDVLTLMIIGIGNDLIDIRRVEKTLERHPERFTSRVFTEIEQVKSDRRLNRAASYAKRFAAKEACAKALGTGIARGVFWRDMGVINLPGGKPTMNLTGGAARRLAEILPKNCEADIHLTITDDFPLAQAIVIIYARAK